MATHPNAPGGAGVYTNAFEIAADMDNEADDVAAKVTRLTRHHAMLLETKVKANVYQWTPPKMPMRHTRTGDYRRSWSTRMTRIGVIASADVGTNRPQARRLEYGFSGPDRLGRVYDDPPRPHAGPALDAVKPAYVAALRQIPDLGG